METETDHKGNEKKGKNVYWSWVGNIEAEWRPEDQQNENETSLVIHKDAWMLLLHAYRASLQLHNTYDGYLWVGAWGGGAGRGAGPLPSWCQWGPAGSRLAGPGPSLATSPPRPNLHQHIFLISWYRNKRKVFRSQYPRGPKAPDPGSRWSATLFECWFGFARNFYVLRAVLVRMPIETRIQKGLDPYLGSSITLDRQTDFLYLLFLSRRTTWTHFWQVFRIRIRSFLSFQDYSDYFLFKPNLRNISIPNWDFSRSFLYKLLLPANLLWAQHPILRVIGPKKRRVRFQTPLPVVTNKSDEVIRQRVTRSHCRLTLSERRNLETQTIWYICLTLTLLYLRG